MCEYGPCTCEYGHIRSTAPTAMGFLVNPSCIYNLPGATRLVEKYAVTRYGQQRENRNNIIVFSIANIFLWKVCNFSVVDEGDCETAWLSAHWGQFGHKRSARQNGADTPIFHLHREKTRHFFEVWGFLYTHAGLCVNGPCKTLGTSRTPQTRQQYIFC